MQTDETLDEELRRALSPVRPPEVFRDHLRRNLELAGRQRQLRGGRPYDTVIDWTTWWKAVALMSGSVAAGSLIAYLIRSRISPRQPA